TTSRGEATISSGSEVATPIRRSPTSRPMIFIGWYGRFRADEIDSAALGKLFTEKLGGGGDRFGELGGAASGLSERSLAAAPAIRTASDLPHQVTGVDAALHPVRRDLRHEQRAPVRSSAQHNHARLEPLRQCVGDRLDGVRIAGLGRRS